MDGLPGQAVHHADAERGKGVLVGGFPDEQAQGLFDKGVETLLGGEITGIAGYRRPEQGRTSTVLWRGFASINASWLPTSFLMRLSFSRSSLHAMTLQCARMEVSPLLCASFRYSSIHSRLIWLERL